MPGLKERLNQKVKTLEPEIITQPDVVNEPENNLILLKNSQSSSFVPDFAITLNEARNRIAMLQEFVKEMMIPDVDYGIIPGCKKPSLYKSGAEKLCDIYGLSKHVEIINRIEDWDKKVFHYEVKAVLVNKKTGLIEAEGIGSCNNREAKYAKQDAYNIINTIVKMAKKRAIIDAVLSATRSSALFTQDIEDFENDSGPVTSIKEQPQKNNTQNQNSPNSGSSQANTKSATRNQLTLIIKLVSEKQISMSEIKNLMMQKYKVPESKLLSAPQADDFIKFLMAYSTGK